MNHNYMMMESGGNAELHFLTDRSRIPRLKTRKGQLWQLSMLLISLFLTLNSAVAQVNLYSFSQDEGTYEEIEGTVVATATGTTSFDSQNWVMPNGTIPFGFAFNNSYYTGFVINSNGYITFGATAPSTYTSSPISSTEGYAGAIAAWGGDLCSMHIPGVATGDVQYAVEGSAPDREFVIQFKNWRPAYTSSTTAVASLNYQIRLIETTNQVVIIYGPAEVLVGAPTTAGTRQIGLRGATNADFDNRINSATEAFTASEEGSTNAGSQAFSYVAGSAQGLPTDGFTYKWTPPVAGTVDLAVLGITGIPVSNCAAAGTPLAITIKNHGSAEIDFATANATVTIAITGASAQTLDVVVDSGTLAVGAIQSFVVDPADFIAAGTHNLDASVSIEGDATTANNTFSSAKIIAAAAVAPPYAEAFATTTAPANWNVTGWTMAANHGRTTNGIFKNIYNTVPTGQFNTAPVGPIVATNELKFDFRVLNYNSTYPGIQIPPTGNWGNIQVQVSTDCGGTYTAIHTINNLNHTVADQSWTTLVLPLADYAAASVTVRVLATWAAGDWFIDIDNLKIETPPTCLPPDLLTSNVTSTSTATISWAAAEEAPDGGYEYYYSAVNTAPVADGTEAAGVSANLTDLDANTTYYVWIRSVCEEGNESVWVAMLPFTTLCDPTGLPYVMPVEAVTVPATPACVIVQNVNADDKTWFTAATADGMTGKVMRYSYNGSAAANDWFYTQSLDLTAGVSYRLKFKYRNAGYAEKLKVAIGGEAVNTAMTQTLFDVTTPTTTSTESEVIDFTVDADGTYNIGFQCYSAANLYLLSVGEISVVVTPTETVDFANIQAFVVNGSATTAMQPCQNVDVYAQAWQDGLTNFPGQGTGLVAWIGYSADNTDPAMWPEAAWTVAAYNVDSGNNDEFKVTYAGLPAGNHYFASRFSILEGPYSYGASDGLWNAETSQAALLSVSIEDIAINTSAASFCGAAEEVTLTASSNNENFTYTWSHGLGNAAVATVTPTATTTYTVTGTDNVTGCTTTSSVDIIVNPFPTDATIDISAASMCAGSIQQLSITGGELAASIVSGVGTFTSTPGSASPVGPNPLQNYWGGNKQQWIYKAQELTALGFVANTAINSIAINLAASNSTALLNVIVRMKNSDTESFTSTTAWETGMTVVRNAASHTPLVGPNVLELDEAFTWDGESNLVVELNYTNNNTGNGSTNTAKYSETDFTSTLYRRADNVTPTVMDSETGPTAGVVQTFNSRVDITFGVSMPASVTWSPAADLYTDAEATVAYVADAVASVVYTRPTGTVSYTATVSSDAGCSVSTPAQEITIFVVSAPELVAAGEGGNISNLIISEYGEGAGGNKKYVEIYNGTGADVNLANYQMWNISNGGEWPETTYSLAGMLANGDAYVIANNVTDVMGADIYVTSVAGFNGDDAVGLAWNGGSGEVFTLIDAVGTNGTDPGAGWDVAGTAIATVDRILIRKATVCAPNANWAVSAGSDAASSEWIVSETAYNATDMTTNLGMHTSACAGGSSSVEFCAASTVSDLNETVTGIDILWYADITGGVAISENTVLESGTYYASQTLNACESPRTAVDVIVTAVVVPDFADISICEGVVFELVPMSPNGVSGTWNPSAIDTAETGNYVFTPNEGECATAQEITITIIPATSSNFATYDPVCYGSEVPALNTTAPNGITGTWNPATINTAESGTMEYVFTPDTVMCGVQQTLEITVLEPLAAPTGESIQDFHTGDTVSDLVVSGTGTVTWYTDATGDTLADPFTELATGDNYFASLTIGACESFLFEVTVGVSLGIDGSDAVALKYYPNPVSDFLVIDYAAGIDSISIHNMIGQSVYNAKAEGTQQTVDMSRLAAGTYIVNVVSAGLVKNFKVIKR